MLNILLKKLQSRFFNMFCTFVFQTLWCSWAVLGPKHRFYFGGDTGYCPVFKKIGKMYGKFSLAALPIGAYEPRQVFRKRSLLVDPLSCFSFQPVHHNCTHYPVCGMVLTKYPLLLIRMSIPKSGASLYSDDWVNRCSDD